MSEAAEYYRQLDLTTATTSTSFVVGGVRHRRETFVSAPDQVIVMRLSADAPGSVSFTAEFDSAQRTTVASPDDATIGLDGISSDQEGVTGEVRFQTLARAVADGGAVSSTSAAARCPSKRGAHDATWYNVRNDRDESLDTWSGAEEL